MKPMEKEEREIPFNYFLIMFNKEIYKRIVEVCSMEMADEDDIYFLTSEEQLEIFNASFYEILDMYLSLTDNKEIVARPENPIDLCNLIFSDIEETPYKHSLLISLQFIVNRYLEILGKGNPTIMSSNDEQEKSLRVVYDRSQRINTFDSTNMSLEEQTDIMVKVLKNTIENNMKLMPFVRYESRTDI